MQSVLASHNPLHSSRLDTLPDESSRNTSPWLVSHCFLEPMSTQVSITFVVVVPPIAGVEVEVEVDVEVDVEMDVEEDVDVDVEVDVEVLVDVLVDVLVRLLARVLV